MPDIPYSASAAPDGVSLPLTEGPVDGLAQRLSIAVRFRAGSIGADPELQEAGGSQIDDHQGIEHPLRIPL